MRPGTTPPLNEAVAETSRPATRPSRNPTIDGLKFISAALIVFIHVRGAAGVLYGPSQAESLQVAFNLTYWALFLFFAVAGYMHGPLGDRGGRWLEKRLIRLAVPYLFWSCILFLWDGAVAAAKGVTLYPLSDELPLRTAKLAFLSFKFIFLAGGGEVLWSLAMLFYCAAIVELVVKTPRIRRISGLAMIALAVAVVQIPEVVVGRITHGAPQFMYAPLWLAIYLAGMEIRATAPARSPQSRGYYVTFATALLVSATVAFSWPSISTPPVMRVIAVVGYSIAALALLRGAHNGIDMFRSSSLAWGGQYLLGVYCSHWLIVWAWGTVADRLRFLPAFSWLALGSAATFGIAVTVTGLMMKSRLLRPVVT